MARLPRLVVPHQPHHVIQTGINGHAFVQEAADYTAFLEWLHDAAKQFKVAIHAYALLPAQMNLLATPSDAAGLGRLMQWVGRYYVPYFNRKYNRSGTLWQGRYKAAVIDADLYFMTCSRYIESIPVQRGVASTPADYDWSSYAHHTGAKLDSLVIDHPLYWALGNTPFDREVAYKALSEQALTADEIHLMKDMTPKGWALGSEKFKASLVKKAGRRVGPSKRGRPPKPKPISSAR